MNRRTIRFLSDAILFFLSAFYGMAQDTAEEKNTEKRNWYIGIQGGVPFGISTFSCFGAGKSRAGYVTLAFTEDIVSMQYGLWKGKE